jgi:nucleoside-diphosphate-sugar epimerase
VKRTILVTGATGVVGFAIVKMLVERGHAVRAIVRDVTRAKAVLDPAVDILAGDVTDRASVERAAVGVGSVFHAAGLPEQWVRDEAIFHRVNTEGTANVLAVAQKAGVERFVYTSTMDVFEAPPGGTLSEDRPATGTKPTAYERSKMAAQALVQEAQSNGLSTVHLNPSAVYGPSPSCTALNKLIVDVVNRKVPLLPPLGIPYVHADGVARAHLHAWEHAPDGGRYLLSDGYIGYGELGQHVAAIAGHGRVPPVAPLWLLKSVVAMTAPLGDWFGLRPPMSRGELAFLQWDVRVDSSKAQRELTFQPTALASGLAETVKYFTDSGGAHSATASAGGSSGSSTARL